MSKRLEDFIKANREEFDDLHPQTDLWARIEEQLPAAFELKKNEKKTFSLGFVMRVAATVIVVMSISFVLYLRSEKVSNSNGLVNIASISPKYAREQVRYTALISSKLNELKTLSKSDPELYLEFSAEIAAMDSTYKKLNHELATSPNQELVLRAMIRNLQIQTEAVNQQLLIIEQLNQTKKEQQNESKNI